MICGEVGERDLSDENSWSRKRIGIFPMRSWLERWSLREVGPLKLFGIGLPLAFLFIQLLGPVKTNPPFEPSRTLVAQLKVTPQVKGILERACQNCHSYETEWPWYSNVAPVSWFVIDHVDHKTVGAGKGLVFFQ